MRKAYVKPALFAETFQMVEHIAAGCDMEGSYFTANQNNGFVCSVDDGSGLALFLDNNTACSGQAFDSNDENLDLLVGTITDGICYTIFKDDKTMFSS